MAFNSSFNKDAWTGASGNQIGFAGDMPDTQPWGFVTDPIHSKPVDPNTPRSNALKATVDTSSTDILEGQLEFEADYYDDGMYGWVMDDIAYPYHDADPGTTGHESSMGPAQARHRNGPDQAHAQDVYQKNQPAGYGKVFFGNHPLKEDLKAWNNAKTPAPNTKQYPAEAREDQSNWPTPFDSTTVAPWRPVDQSTERIPMRRIAEDDRPVYRYIAVGPQNIRPIGNQWGVQYQSNIPIQNVTPVPMMPQTPVDPWITQEQATDDVTESSDVFGGWGLQ